MPVHLKPAAPHSREKFNINVYLVLGDCPSRETVKELEGLRETQGNGKDVNSSGPGGKQGKSRFKRHLLKRLLRI